MLKEIVEGEKQLSEEESDVRSLRMALGLDAFANSSQTDERPATKSAGSSNQRVGQRKPKRDSVGQVAS